MSDERGFKIKITTSADTSGAQKTAAELDKVANATKNSVPVTEEAGKATEKLGLSHRELHMALRQLGPEFAHLGGMAQYALHNQTLIPVLGLVGAFALWEHRVNACVVALGGVELPDNAKQQVGQIGALAQSWKTFNTALMDAVTAYDSVDEASKRNMSVLKQEEDQKKKLLDADKKLELSELEKQKAQLPTAEYETRKAAIENRYEEQSAKDDDEAQAKKLQAKAKQGDALVESSKQKMAEAAKIRLGTPEQEAAIDEQMKAQAEAAEKSKKEREERINDLSGAMDATGSPLEKITRFGRLVGRYGLVGAQDEEGMAASLKTEKEGGAGEQITIDRYAARMKSKAARDEQLERRKKLVADAGKEMGEGYRIWKEGPDDVAEYQRSVDNKRAIAATNSQTQRNTADAKTLQSPEGKLLADAIVAEQTLQHGGEISFRQQVDIKRAAELTHGAIYELGQSFVGSHTSLQKQILQLAKQIRNSSSPP
jgi:hypothetical protein